MKQREKRIGCPLLRSVGPGRGIQAAENPEPDFPEDPDREDDLPDVNPGSNPENPGDNPGVAEPGKPARVIAAVVFL